jgi:putative ABC transport system permease protein
MAGRHPPAGARPSDDEIEFHIEMQTRRFIAAGLDPAAARAKALARFGSQQRAREASRAIALDMETLMTRSAWWPSLAQDVRFALRVLRASPLFTITALLTIGVGIGAVAAIFSVVNAVLLRDLPYPHADRTAVIWNAYRQEGLEQAAVSAEEFADIAAAATAFDRLAALRPQVTTLTGACSTGADCEPERLNAYVVSPGLFDLLGASPALGRTFTPSDGAAGAPAVVVLSDAVWQRRFGADPAIVGRIISLGGSAREVVGVMPAGLRFPDEPIGYLKPRADAWIPRSWEMVKDGRGNQYLAVIGRLGPGRSLPAAQASLDAVAETFRARFPDRYAPPKVQWRLAASSLRDQMFGDIRPALLLLFGAVGCVLLIACANVANLTAARGTTRRREMAVRTALGAGRGRLVQQLMIETALITGAGALAGVGIAELGLRAARAMNPGNVPGLDAAGIDGVVLAFAAALAAIAGALVGLVPALGQSQVDPQAGLSDGSRGAGAAAARRRVRAPLIVIEVALAVIVLVGAGLLVRSFLAMARVDTGFVADGRMTAHLSLPRASYTPAAKAVEFQRALVERLSSLPGVTRASAVYPLPMSEEAWSGTIVIEGRDPTGRLPPAHTEYAVAHPKYFETMGIRLVEGREFQPTDTEGSMLVGIVDVEFARTYWPGQSAVGRRISAFGTPGAGPWTTIVGVVGHVRNRGARAVGEPQFYFSALQKPEFGMTFVTRSDRDSATLGAAIRTAVRELDPTLPIASLAPMDHVIARFTARDRFNVALFSIFGGVALALAAVGLYGVLASLVSQRTREIGIRLALGGRPGDVVRSVLGEGVLLAAIGLALGLAAAAALSRFVETILFAVKPLDPVTYAMIAAIVLAVSLLASYWPARRAMMVDPVTVLRGL